MVAQNGTSKSAIAWIIDDLVDARADISNVTVFLEPFQSLLDILACKIKPLGDVRWCVPALVKNF